MRTYLLFRCSSQNEVFCLNDGCEFEIRLSLHVRDVEGLELMIEHPPDQIAVKTEPCSPFPPQRGQRRRLLSREETHGGHAVLQLCALCRQEPRRGAGCSRRPVSTALGPGELPEGEETAVLAGSHLMKVG